MRYDTLLRDHDRPGTRVQTLTLGFNVFFAETTKIQINFNHRDDQAARPITNEILSQVQFGF